MARRMPAVMLGSFVSVATQPFVDRGGAVVIGVLRRRPRVVSGNAQRTAQQRRAESA
jgi:hypothetical protein